MTPTPITEILLQTDADIGFTEVLSQTFVAFPFRADFAIRWQNKQAVGYCR